MTKFGTVTQVVEKRVPNGSVTPPPKGWGSGVPQIIWDSYLRPNSLT